MAATEFEKEARRIDEMDYRGVAGRVVEFDGDLALLIGGGGASLTIFDAIRRHGGEAGQLLRGGRQSDGGEGRRLDRAPLVPNPASRGWL